MTPEQMREEYDSWLLATGSRGTTWDLWQAAHSAGYRAGVEDSAGVSDMFSPDTDWADLITERIRNLVKP